MVRVVLVVRELGKLKPDYSLHFDLPEVPAIGGYVSIQRPTEPEPFGEDVIVRKVWWRLHHPETAGFSSGDREPKVGKPIEIFVECEPAIGPYSSDQWRASLEGHKVEEFEVDRFSVRQSDLKQK